MSEIKYILSWTESDIISNNKSWLNESNLIKYNMNFQIKLQVINNFIADSKFIEGITPLVKHVINYNSQWENVTILLSNFKRKQSERVMQKVQAHYREKKAYNYISELRYSLLPLLLFMNIKCVTLHKNDFFLPFATSSS